MTQLQKYVGLVQIEKRALEHYTLFKGDQYRLLLTSPGFLILTQQRNGNGMEGTNPRVIGKKLKKRWVLQETRPDASVLCYRPPAEASDLN